MNQFGHIGIYVKDLEVSKRFYTEILGCEIVKEYSYPEMTLCFIDAGGTHIELIYKEEQLERPMQGAIDHLAFKVDSLDTMIEKLDAAGTEILSPPRIVGSSRILFFKGPNGERLELTEHYRP